MKTKKRKKKHSGELRVMKTTRSFERNLISKFLSFFSNYPRGGWGRAHARPLSFAPRKSKGIKWPSPSSQINHAALPRLCHAGGEVSPYVLTAAFIHCRRGAVFLSLQGPRLQVAPWMSHVSAMRQHFVWCGIYLASLACFAPSGVPLASPGCSRIRIMSGAWGI